MPDRENVLKGLECCAAMSGDKCQKCPYEHECRDTDLPYGMPHLAADALALLKEQEAVEPFYKGEDFMDYFTKRTLGRCGHCKAPLPALDGMRSKFCWMCGRPVKWE